MGWCWKKGHHLGLTSHAPAFNEGIAVVVPQRDDRDHKIQPLLSNLSYLKHFKTELEKHKDETIGFTMQIHQQKPMN